MKMRMSPLISMLGIGLLSAAMSVSAAEMGKSDTMKKSMSDDTMTAKPVMQDEMKKEEMMDDKMEKMDGKMEKMEGKMEEKMDKMETKQ